jgi:crossover junction endodeoxyribonuclease RusA
MIVLPYPPSVNGIWRTVNGRVYKSAKAQAWAREAAWIVKTSGVRIKGPFVLIATAHRPDRRRRDLDNLPKAVMDALTAGGAIGDDSLCMAALWRWDGVGASMHMHGDAALCPILSVVVGAPTAARLAVAA